jgi:hypothetical protein
MAYSWNMKNPAETRRQAQNGPSFEFVEANAVVQRINGRPTLIDAKTGNEILHVPRRMARSLMGGVASVTIWRMEQDGRLPKPKMVAGKWGYDSQELLKAIGY